MDILTEVADEWAEELGYAAPAPGDVVDWLADTTEHAYNYLSDDAWQATTGEIRRVYGIAQRLAGLDPIITGHTCPNDGGRLARYPLEDGFTDWELCPACGTPWTPDAYAQAVKRFLDDRSTSGPD